MMDPETISIISIIVLLSISGAVGMFLLSRIFQVKRLEQVARAELIFAISTVFLVAFFIGMVTYGEEKAVLIVKDIIEHQYSMEGEQAPEFLSGVTLIGITKIYMAELYGCLKFIYASAYWFNIIPEFGTALTYDVFMHDVLSGWAWKPLTSVFHYLASTSAFMALLYFLFVHILNFIQAAAIPLFLPLGILLRAFPPTRGVGAYILSFSLGFYLVFPFAYIIAMSLTPLNVCTMPDTEEFGCVTVSPGLANYMVLEAENSEQEMTDAYVNLWRDLGGLTANLCCLPFITMMMTLSFILATTNLFGANLPEVGRGFIKLI